MMRGTTIFTIYIQRCNILLRSAKLRRWNVKKSLNHTRMRFAIYTSVSRAWLWPQWLLRNELPSFNSILAHKDKTTMNNYCKKCRLRDGCLRKCKEAEIYEQGYCDGVSDGYKGAVDALTPDEQQPKLIIKVEGLKK